ncbi:peptidase S58 DmpA [Neobacillus bataviensis LMG 21833]|uniref:Peptidase S58 DmpA n=1 Tax=Neobacillus bataviensis LMG 21833 TaxID=1117379 RepID=K6DGF7_9BACI|nr:P1 family peptidase [Neobacillus bataviensis]EKN71652.1 peptidase S58 DmpA [Neobacillus bataviensis LMG 21833]
MDRMRLRDLGITIGRFKTGKYNSITDIQGVKVGHVTLSHETDDGRKVQTGVTAILPHSDNIFQEKVVGNSYIINGFGKTVGTIQLQELGVIESPILLTNTFSVPAVWEGTIRYLLDQNPQIGTTTGTANVIVGECNDGYLNDIRGLHVKPEHAHQAIVSAASGIVEEGCVGAGTGMSCLGYKGGIGTSSRMADFGERQYTVGAFVLSNFGERKDLRIPGGGLLETEDREKMPDGSIMMILATDAPLNDRQLKRLAKRASFGLSRTGSYAAHGSGDIVIAFSTAHRIPHEWPSNQGTLSFNFLREDGRFISQLFEMSVDAVEEAIWNSICKATTTEGNHGRIREEIPYQIFAGPSS